MTSRSTLHGPQRANTGPGGRSKATQRTDSSVLEGVAHREGRLGRKTAAVESRGLSGMGPPARTGWRRGALRTLKGGKGRQCRGNTRLFDHHIRKEGWSTRKGPGDRQPVRAGLPAGRRPLEDRPRRGSLRTLKGGNGAQRPGNSCHLNDYMH